MNKQIFTGLALMLAMCLNIPLIAQQTAIYDDPAAAYYTAHALFDNQQFGAASRAFRKVMETAPEGDELLRVNARYYDAVCAMELEHEDAEYKLTEFIRQNPENTLAKRAHFQLGKLQFSNGKYERALESFTKVELPDLDQEERTEYFYKKGYSQYKTKDPDRALASLSKVINTKSTYAPYAIYYFAVISYEKGDNKKALENFEKIKDNRTFQKSVRTYLAHLYHRQGDYDKMMEVAVPAFEEASGKDKPGLALLIGDAYYQEGNYNEALPYFELYERTAQRSMGRDEAYQLGYTFFMMEDYNAAIHNFQRAVGEDDALAQNAYYHLGYCYLQTGQKKYASNAFSSALKMDFNPDVAEDALFNYAKLSMEVSNDPYNTAIKALEEYIDKYPDSPRTEEAYEFLANLYLSTRNFAEALRSIESIRSRSGALNEAYQKICFYRGIELFNSGDYDAAISLFKKASQEDHDKYIAAEASLWMGEAFYRQKNSWGAIKYYKEFLDMPGAEKIEGYSNAFYNLGYSYFNKEEYSNAITWFRKFVDYRGPKDDKLEGDALLRLGDCYFIRKNYSDAISFYNQAIRSGNTRTDYALYQKAITQGASGLFNDKTRTLKELINRQGTSSYTDDAKYELAVTYMLLNNNSEALSWFNKLVKDHPDSKYAVKSMLKSGLIYYNDNKNDQALRVLKQVVDQYPATPESREALNSIRNIYIDENRVSEYYAYAEGLSFADVSVSEQDSVTYIAAENLYMESKCNEAIRAFGDYLERFPYGSYSVNASYYKAECELKNGNREQALADLDHVIKQPTSEFTANSLLQAARLCMVMEDWQKALTYYGRMKDFAELKEHEMEALEGMTDCNYELRNWSGAITTAMMMLSNESIDDARINNAHYIMARSYYAMDNLENARVEFSITEKLADDVKGAESKYMVAYIDYATGKLTQAENGIFELSENYASYDYWVAKGFLLLSDIYLALGNEFQARETLKSIIENYRGPELGEIAAQKLKALDNENVSGNPGDTL